MQPFENNFGVDSNGLPVFIAHEATILADAPGNLCGFCRFGLGFAPPEFCQQLLRQWNASGIRHNTVVANTLSQQRCLIWKADFEHHQTLRTPAICGHGPIFGLMLQALSFVLVPGNGLEHEQFEHKQY